MKALSTLVITAALIVGLVGCGEATLPVQYNLTISSTEGGAVTTPGEGTFIYDEGEVVELVAEAEEGYHFVKWTGDVGTIADVDDATTSITVNNDYSIAAEFAQVEAAPSSDPQALISSVDSICGLGVPGPLYALSAVPIPVVAGDDDTTPVPSTVVMASGLGDGQVVALSGSFLTNEALELFDNRQFGSNVIDWLDRFGTGEVLVTTGHGEWYGDNFSNFKAELESRGYNVTRFPRTLTPSILLDVGVVLINNAWGNVLSSEIDALTDFVTNGGGLFLEGLGWSWEPYNPGFTLDDYPMNKIAEPYGIRWINGYISDPTDNYEGQPIFHTFYPNIETETTYELFSYIENTTSAHPGDLPSFLQINEAVRTKYTNAHLLLATAIRELDQSSSQRQEIYDFYEGLINAYPQYFQKSVVYSKTTESAMAWIRERVYRTFVDALPLTDARKSEISATIGLHNRYLDIWNDFTVILLDNTSLNEEQKDFIYAYLNSLPNGIHNLRCISVVEFLSQAQPEVPLWGLGGWINIFGVDIGGHGGNCFPEDVSSGIVDTFCIVVAHEINHVVDAFYIENNDVLKTRKDELIADAGHEHLNYLRSMFEDGFFQQAPQEFFASISHQWFTDSKKTIELGLVRFDDGYRHPINQALFFADVYSLGENFTYFYTIDTQGSITRQTIALSRDARGRIESLTIDSVVYNFTLDANGDVTAYSVTD